VWYLLVLVVVLVLVLDKILIPKAEYEHEDEDESRQIACIRPDTAEHLNTETSYSLNPSIELLDL